MDRLPPEILSNIISFLDDRRKSHIIKYSRTPYSPSDRYALISRQWQPIVEPITFRDLHLTPRKLETAEAGGYLTPLRLSYIRTVEFDFIFPAHDLAVSTNIEGWDDQLVFNKVVRQLFGFLARIPARQTPLIRLTLNIQQPRRRSTHQWLEDYLDIDEEVALGYERPLYMELSEDWEESLPELPMISVFDTTSNASKLFFAPRSINLLSSKMTRLRKARWNLYDAERHDLDLRIRQRTNFAHTLEKLPRSLQKFKLWYHRVAPGDIYFDTSSIAPDAEGDILSRELCRLFQRDGLRRVMLEASLDSTIFWPTTEPSGALPEWPTLEELNIDFHEYLPSGQWVGALVDEVIPDQLPALYADGEGGRTVMISFEQTVIDALSLAGGRAASRMPKIQYIGCRNQGWPRVGFSFTKVVVRDEPCLVFFGEPKTPHPSQEVLDAWRRAAKVHGFTREPCITNNFDKAPHF